MTVEILNNASVIKNMVIHAVTDVTKTMLGRSSELVNYRRIQQGEPSESSLVNDESGVVYGNVGFAGIATGMVYFGMSQSSAVNVAAGMLGMTTTEVSDGHSLVNDVVGELSNMTAGAFKNQLCDKGYHCRLSIPSIIRGKYFVVEGDEAELREIYEFKIGEDLLVFELFMKLDPDSGDDGRL